MKEWKVNEDESGLKLIDFLKLRLKNCGTRQIKKALEKNGCLLNGRPERFATKLVAAGDTVSFSLPIASLENKVSPKNIIFENDSLFIYDKPPGISSEDPNFLKKLQALANPLHLLHRLDKETSGILLFAKTTAMRDAMLDLFKQRKINKTYLAIVDGIPKQNSGIIDNYLGKLHAYEGQAIWGKVKPDVGLRARTEWQILQVGKQASLLLCRPITGRTHQIRVHCSEMGHPILGDYHYGRKFKCQVRAQRCFLHAFQVSFKNPANGNEILVEAPIPLDFNKILQELELKI
jgi:RluA family pseudouridine synthase